MYLFMVIYTKIERLPIMVIYFTGEIKVKSINTFIASVFVFSCTLIGGMNTGYPMKGFVTGLIIVSIITALSIKIGVFKSEMIDDHGWVFTSVYWAMGFLIIFFPTFVIGIEGWLPVIISSMLVILWNNLYKNRKVICQSQ